MLLKIRVLFPSIYITSLLDVFLENVIVPPVVPTLTPQTRIGFTERLVDATR